MTVVGELPISSKNTGHEFRQARCIPDYDCLMSRKEFLVLYRDFHKISHLLFWLFAIPDNVNYAPSMTTASSTSRNTYSCNNGFFLSKSEERVVVCLLCYMVITLKVLQPFTANAGKPIRATIFCGFLQYHPIFILLPCKNPVYFKKPTFCTRIHFKTFTY